MGADQSVQTGRARSVSRAGTGRVHNQKEQEAIQWLYQAYFDLQAVENDMGKGDQPPAYEWACFKCQQAGEKAIKSVLILNGLSMDVYRENIQKMHNTGDMARDTSEDWIRVLAQRLYRATGSVGSMRYPQQARGGSTSIPHTTLTRERAVQARAAAAELVKNIHGTYFPGLNIPQVSAPPPQATASGCVIQ